MASYRRRRRMVLAREQDRWNHRELFLLGKHRGQGADKPYWLEYKDPTSQASSRCSRQEHEHELSTAECALSLQRKNMDCTKKHAKVHICYSFSLRHVDYLELSQAELRR